MPTEVLPALKGVSETLLMTLYARARESQRPDAMLEDEKAVELVSRIDTDFPRLRMHGHDEVAVIMRMRRFDDLVRGFLARHMDAAVVHIGCGLDTRFERVDDGHVEWFDLDLPAVITLRQQLLPSSSSRQHTLDASVFQDDWLMALDPFRLRPFMFLAEGVFPYFSEAQLRPLFLKLSRHFPGCELVCDAHTPFVIWADNLQLALSKVSARLHWGLKHGKDVESWGDEIRLLEEWFYFDDPEPRMSPYRWMGKISFLAKSTGIFHYQLGAPQ
jgi:O-methyltransferase involved in polyketide biosynthesis